MSVAEARKAGGDEVLRRAELDGVVRHLRGFAFAVRDAHRELRAEERAQVLELPAARGTRVAADRDIAVARRHARQARSLLKTKRGGTAWKELRRELGKHTGDLEDSLAEARGHYLDALDRADLAAADAGEMRTVWDEMAGAVKADGVDGIFDRLDAVLRESDEALTADQDFGRRARSPLERWQWILIGVIIGVAIAAVIACLIWFGCAWIKEIFVATCWGLGWTGVCAGFTF